MAHFIESVGKIEMIKNIIFDVGKVLVEVRWQEVMRELGFDEATVELVSNATVCSSTWGEYDRSKLPYEEMLTKFIMNNPTVEKEIRLFMEHEKEAIREFPYAREWVKSFHDKGYKCYVLSNYPKGTFANTREERSFEEFLDGAVYSFQVQMIKPEKEIYQVLLERYDLIPEESVFIDDNQANVEVARELGMYAIHFQTKCEAEKELEKLGV